MVYNHNKKGAVEMSLNLIIMLIIGMVVLGLVIGFVNSLVNKGTESFDKQLGDNEKLKLDEVKNCPDNLCVNPSPSVSVKKGGKTNIFIKVRAVNPPPTTGFTIEVGPGALDYDTTAGLTYRVIDDEGNDICGTSGCSASSAPIILSGPGFKLNSGSEDAQMYTLKVTGDVVIGTYYLTLYSEFDNLAGSEEYVDSKTITLEVN